MIKPIEVIFYYKEDCSLCDEMLKNFNQFIGEQCGSIKIELVMRDIEDDKRWFDRFREYVPVLTIDDKEICHYFFDEDEFLESITVATSKSPR